MHFLYSTLWLLVLPFAALKLWWRSRRESGYSTKPGERLGLAASVATVPTLWIHAVSVGETRAAAPLIAALRARHPHHRILVTHMTATGRTTARGLYGEFAELAWLPWDLPWAQRAFLRRWKPALGIVMETEIWPNLLREARRAGVPMVLANARLSARSAMRYARLDGFVRNVLADFTAIGAQTGDDGARFRSLGAQQVSVTGNLKFDICAPAAQIALGTRWHQAIGARQVLLLASTRDGEEALLLDALLAAIPPDVLIALVPRHPQRFDEVATLIASRGLGLCRRSEGRWPTTDTRIWLGDAMGEMFAWYRLADLALIGGSWLPLGGQNLIEACSVGCPVLSGPHTFNFEQATEDAIAAGAALRVDDATAAAAEARRLLAEPATLGTMGEAGRAYAQAHRGATARTMALVDPLLASTT